MALRTAWGDATVEKARPLVYIALNNMDDLRFDAARECLVAAGRHVDDVKDRPDTEDGWADWFVLGRTIDAVRAYVETWEKIGGHGYRQAWDRLQDTLDCVRLVHKFSDLRLRRFAEQLPRLEEAFPYTLFGSIGAVYSRCECSLCGEDIDSPQCPHMRGELYRGQLAVAVVRECARVDHIGVVTEPEDKRCVVESTYTEADYWLLDTIAGDLSLGKIKPSQFSHFTRATRILESGDPAPVDRNSRCPCGSGKKYKKCCAARQSTIQHGVGIILTERSSSDDVFEKSDLIARDAAVDGEGRKARNDSKRSRYARVSDEGFS